MTSTMMMCQWRRKIHNVVNRNGSYPSTGTLPNFYLFMLLLTGCYLLQNALGKRTSLNSAVSTSLDPGDLVLSCVLPGVHFLALLSFCSNP